MLSDRQLSPWAHLMKAHLKQWRPKEYKQLLQDGNLNDHVQEIVNQAEEELNSLLNQGFAYNQAFEKIRDQLYPRPEKL